jgi:acyl-CoA thioesterase-1
MASAGQHTILVMGDSISAAYGMSLQQGWVTKLEQHINRDHDPVSIINASISGETVAGGLRRLPTLLLEHAPELVIIELGGNDGLRGYPLGKLRDQLTEMVALSQQSNARVILLPMEIPPNYGNRYTLGFRQSFALVASNTGSILGPFILDGVATDPALMQEDGIHPTVQAQDTLMQNALPTILHALEAL